MIYSNDAEEIRPEYTIFTIPESTRPRIRYQIKYTADVCGRSGTSIFVSCMRRGPSALKTRWIYASGTKTPRFQNTKQVSVRVKTSGRTDDFVMTPRRIWEDRALKW
ncbi:hypothetical protein NPIL_303891 [Nephila pilipes]|uniref:Uncharacterized protein n=1 Tax=Nephila pilipes TaxID=299642 RepID=A0A8X6N8L2_NEPPI|nr:hypothetical protein NPIL_303891 [Nephila pilipes]